MRKTTILSALLLTTSLLASEEIEEPSEEMLTKRIYIGVYGDFRWTRDKMTQQIFGKYWERGGDFGACFTYEYLWPWRIYFGLFGEWSTGFFHGLFQSASTGVKVKDNGRNRFATGEARLGYGFQPQGRHFIWAPFVGFGEFWVTPNSSASTMNAPFFSFGFRFDYTVNPYSSFGLLVEAKKLLGMGHPWQYDVEVPIGYRPAGHRFEMRFVPFLEKQTWHRRINYSIDGQNFKARAADSFQPGFRLEFGTRF